MSTEPSEAVENITVAMERAGHGAKFIRVQIAKIKADALRTFADELEAQEKLSVDDALTVGVLRERADEIEGEA